MSKITRTGSGRTTGSFSFVKIPLEELVKKFADSKTPIVVRRKWAETVGFTDLTMQNVQAISKSIMGTAPQDSVVTVVDLNKL